jgi:hypothetical protein
MSGERDGAQGVGDDEVVGSEGPLDVIDGDERLALPRAPHHDLAASDRTEIEGVEGLPLFEEEVVRDVDEVVDRALPDRFESLPKPGRRRRDPDATHRGTRVALARIPVLDAHGQDGVDALATGRRRRRRTGERRSVAELALEERCDLARHATNAQTIGPVRREADVQHGVVDPERGGDRCAVGSVQRAQLEQAACVGVELELGPGAEHAGAGLPPDLRLLDRQPAGECGSDEGDGSTQPLACVRCAADDGQSLGRPDRHGTDRERVRIGMGFPRDDRAQHDPVELGAAALDPLDLHTGHRETIRDGFGCEAVEIDEVAEPVPANAHGEIRRSG